MTRLSCSSLILSCLAIAGFASPALAGETGYRAQPVAGPAEALLVAGGLAWRCDSAGCAAGRGNSRPLVACQALVRKVGEVRSFAAAGTLLTGDALEKCNSRAR